MKPPSGGFFVGDIFLHSALQHLKEMASFMSILISLEKSLSLSLQTDPEMPESLYYLIYVSKTKSHLSEAQLVEMLDQSRTKNMALGITGMLLYMKSLPDDVCAGRFIQVLEGKEAHIKSLCQSIKEDSRHYGVTILSEGPQKKRYFAEWTMGFTNLETGNNYPSYFNPDSLFIDQTQMLDANHLLIFLRSYYTVNK